MQIQNDVKPVMAKWFQNTLSRYPLPVTRYQLPANRHTLQIT